MEKLKCDKCSLEIEKKDYNGYGECFGCFEGLMKEVKMKGGVAKDNISKDNFDVDEI